MIQKNIINAALFRSKLPGSLSVFELIACSKKNLKQNVSLWKCLIKNNFIRIDDLLAISQEQQNNGKSVVWCLENNNRWDILKLLLEHNLINEKNLTPKTRDYLDKSVKRHCNDAKGFENISNKRHSDSLRNLGLFPASEPYKKIQTEAAHQEGQNAEARSPR